MPHRVALAVRFLGVAGVFYNLGAGDGRGILGVTVTWIALELGVESWRREERREDADRRRHFDRQRTT